MTVEILGVLVDGRTFGLLMAAGFVLFAYIMVRLTWPE